jgi:hypothetical protein
VQIAHKAQLEAQRKAEALASREAARVAAIAEKQRAKDAKAAAKAAQAEAFLQQKAAFLHEQRQRCALVYLLTCFVLLKTIVNLLSSMSTFSCFSEQLALILACLQHKWASHSYHTARQHHDHDQRLPSHSAFICTVGVLRLQARTFGDGG